MLAISLLAIENYFHHSDNIYQIVSFVCFHKARIGFSKKINHILNVSSLVLYDDKIKYVDLSKITNLEVGLLFLTVQLLKDKAQEKGLVNVYIFNNPLLSKTR